MNRLHVRVLAIGLCSSGLLVAQDWTAFRGPHGDGTTTSTAPLTWDRETGVRWRVPLARAANGSPVVSAGRVFLTTAEDDEGQRRSLYCYDAKTGKELWVRTVEHDSVMPTHPTNPYGGSTPAADGERVVVWHGSAGLWCYDFEGKLCWKRPMGEFRHKWGYGTSPVLHRGRVVLHSGPGKQPFVAAFDLATGKTIWRQVEAVENYGEDGMTPRLIGSWCTPLIVERSDVAAGDAATNALVLCVHPTRIVAYDFEDGAVVWTCAGVSAKRGDLAYSSPVLAGDLCYVQGGYVGPAIAVRLGGTGDVTESRRAWYHPERASAVGSGVFAGGHIYMPYMDALAFIDPAEGKVLWVERVGKAQVWTSVVRAGDRLYVTNQRGTTVVFRPNPEKFEVLATNALGERSNSTPAVANGELFLRTHEALYCIAEPGEGGAVRAEGQGEGKGEGKLE